MKFPVSVYLCGGEGTGWALDADVETTRQSLLALPDLVKLTSLEEADVVHSVWEYPLLRMDPSRLDNKRIVCHVCNDLMRTYEDPSMVAVGETLGLWVPISRKAQEEIRGLGYQSHYIPYSVDTDIFTSSFESEVSGGVRAKYKLPADSFVISSFMRDSSGADLQKPKEQKGVEFFVAIAVALKRENLPVHFLLAGPRRHWLRKKFTEYDISYTFVGREVRGDDNQINILSPAIINELYHASDLHLVTSRWEGGPRAVLETAATMTPIFCTPVGMAPDILESECLITAVDETVAKIKHLIYQGKETYPLRVHYDRVISNHTPGANIDRFKELYDKIESVPVFQKKNIHWQRTDQVGISAERSIVRRIWDGIVSRKKTKGNHDLTIGLWHEYHKPPYGGGNQFMLALKKGLEQKGVKVEVNKLNPGIDVYICNSAWFNTKILETKSKKYPIKMIHRIDGPISLYRGQGRKEDDEIFSLNKRFASATVFQSAYSYMKSSELGYSPVSPMVIHNAVNKEIFNEKGKKSYDQNGKISLISTAWSDNPRKGGPFYKWLDENLDFKRFEYTFVGRVQQEFQNIKHIAPLNSEKLAQVLHQHDIYITASQHEPCSNALLEALACGLPALYRNDGGSSELVEFGGLPFNDENDFAQQLERIIADYKSFQSSIYIKSMDDVAETYYELSKKIINYHND